MDCSLPGSSVHGIFQARVLEWGAIAFSAAGFLIETKKGKLKIEKGCIYQGSPEKQNQKEIEKW